MGPEGSFLQVKASGFQAWGFSATQHRTLQGQLLAGTLPSGGHLPWKMLLTSEANHLSGSTSRLKEERITLNLPQWKGQRTAIGLTKQGLQWISEEREHQLR